MKLVMSIIILGFALLVSCEDLQYKERTITIAVSKLRGSDSYLNYYKWLRDNNERIDCVDLYYRDFEQAMAILENSDGLLLTGGPDVHPFRFGKSEEASRCEIDLYRDTLEFALISKALELGLPIMAICRGEQIMNVAMGGSLIIDLPADKNTTSHQSTGYDARHNIKIVSGTLLSKIIGSSKAVVNSNHHQAVDSLSGIFMPSAFSDDGIIEAFEMKDYSRNPFLLAVQWHPERLIDRTESSKKIAKAFLAECKSKAIK